MTLFRMLGENLGDIQSWYLKLVEKYEL